MWWVENLEINRASEIFRTLKMIRNFRDSASAKGDFFVLCTREYTQIRMQMFYVNFWSIFDIVDVWYWI